MKYFYLLISVFLIVNISFGKEPLDTVSISSYQKKASYFIYENPDHNSALQYIEDGINLSKEDKDSLNLAHFYFLKAELYINTYPNRSLQFYFKAKDIYSTLKDTSRLSETIQRLAVLRNIDNEQRRLLLNEALYLSEKQQSKGAHQNIHNSLGIYYFERQVYDSALYYYNTFLNALIASGVTESRTAKIRIAGSYSNIGMVYLKQEKYDTALQYFYRALSTLPLNSQRDYSLNMCSNIMETYLKLRNKDSAEHYMYVIEGSFDLRPDIEEDAYRNWSEFYQGNNQLEKAFLYYKKADSVKYAQVEKDQANVLNLIELEYDSQIRKEKLATLNAEMSKAQNTFVLLLIVLSLTVFFSLIVFHLQRQKAHKDRERLRAKQKLINAELNNSEIKRKHLNDELTSYAVGVAQNQSLLDSLRKEILRISEEKDTEKIQDQLREMNIRLLQMSNSQKSNEKFIEKSRKINYSLIFHLRSNFPHLMESDINFLILIFLKFGPKEISVVYNIEPESVKTKRYRLRKKLQMKPEDSFEEFFDKIVSENKIDHS